MVTAKEEIFWLLTAKGVCTKMTEIWKSPVDDAIMMEALRPGDVRKLLDNRLARVPPQTALSWLTWGEDKYASCLTPSNRRGILLLANKYGSRVFYRANGTLLEQQPYNYEA